MTQKTGAYIYTRVSTAMQTEGYSLDAQRQKILDYAKYRGFRVCGEYSDAGFSGKNIAGRLQFQQMLEDIAARKQDVQYVLVFKLSRFGRNAADVLSSLQLMQDFGVNLICVEDNIDSSADSGKLMISVMSAMAEIERENILVQTMAGRRQKASAGGWNGGFAPYGYELTDGRLQIVADEARVIQETFQLYISTSNGATYVARELNRRYTKKIKTPNDVARFTTDFVKRVLDNPVYYGKIAYGRTVNEKIEGKRNEYHRISQKDRSQVILSDGTHEPIVTEAVWLLARQKREALSYRPDKTDAEHHYLLAGLVLCPNCGSRMYGRMNGRKRKKDGTLYAPSYSYVCRTHFAETGVVCSSPASYPEKALEKAVREMIVWLVRGDGFRDLAQRSLREEYDADRMNAELEAGEKERRRLQKLQQQIENRLNAIDYDGKNAARLEESCNSRLFKVMDDLTAVENRLTALRVRLKSAETAEDARRGICDFLTHFGEIYDMMEGADKRDLLRSLIHSIEVYPKAGKSKGQWIKTVHFHFPMAQNDGTVYKSISFSRGGSFPTSSGSASSPSPLTETTTALM